MKRSRVLALGQPVWRELFDKSICDLEVRLVPGAAPELRGVFGANNDAIVATQVCRDAFIEFRNWTEDDGTPIKNSMEERLKIYGAPVLRRAINNALEALNAEVLSGEESADSE